MGAGPAASTGAAAASPDDTAPRHAHPIAALDAFIGQLSRTLEGHSDVVLGVACHPTADMIVTGGMDKDLRSIRVWELQAAAGAAAPAGA